MMFPSESALERYIRQLIATHITSQHPQVYALDNKKAVNLAKTSRSNPLAAV